MAGAGLRRVTPVYLLAKSRQATLFASGAVAATAVAIALGQSSRWVITRDGALGVPLPLVVGMCGAMGMICLAEPNPELIAALPRPRWHARGWVAGYVWAVCAVAVGATVLVAPGLASASIRNTALALTSTFLVGLWRPLVAWVPTTMFFALSWFYGTPAYGGSPAWWALPVHPPAWSGALAGVLLALSACSLWVGAPGVAERCRRRGGR